MAWLSQCTKVGYTMPDNKCYECSYWPNTQAEKDQMVKDGYEMPDDANKVNISFSGDKQEWMDLMSVKQSHVNLMGLGDWGKYDFNGQEVSDPNFPALLIFVPSQQMTDLCEEHVGSNPFYCFQKIYELGEQSKTNLKLYDIYAVDDFYTQQELQNPENQPFLVGELSLKNMEKFWMCDWSDLFMRFKHQFFRETWQSFNPEGSHSAKMMKWRNMSPVQYEMREEGIGGKWSTFKTPVPNKASQPTPTPTPNLPGNLDTGDKIIVSKDI